MGLRIHSALMIVTFLISFVTIAREKLVPKVFYGADDRKEFFEVSTNLQVMSEAVFAIVDDNDVLVNRQSTDKSASLFFLQPKTLKEQNRLCDGVRYAEQASPAFCSGFLIDDDIVVTAGHCVTETTDCNSIKFIQGYKNNSVSEVGKNMPISDNNIYECTEVLAREKNSSGIDFAIVRLDRKVNTNFVFKIRTDGKVSDKANLMVVGHPSGIPLKYTPNAIVRSNVNEIYFQMESDTFSGNSGSAVIDPTTGIVEGILVRGERDFVTSAQGCMVVNSCATGACRGEDVVRITKLPIKTLGLSHNN